MERGANITLDNMCGCEVSLSVRRDLREALDGLKLVKKEESETNESEERQLSEQ